MGIFPTGVVYKNVTFYVDTKDPHIIATAPVRELANGSFDVWFREANPVSLVLYYHVGPNGLRTEHVNLSDCADHPYIWDLVWGMDKSKKCNVFVDLMYYHNQDITYWFELTDIGDKTKTSRKN